MLKIMLGKWNGTMPASALASVLVVCTLILIGMMLVMSLWDSDLMLYSGFYSRERRQAALSSGFVRYCRDSTLPGLIKQDSCLLLFPEDGSSRIRYRRRRWGLYEVAGVASAGGQWKSVRLFGKASESGRGAALYVPDNQKALLLSGDSFLDGNICLSRNGITYSQVRSEFFRGTPVAPGKLSASGREFPEFDPETVEEIRCLLDASGETAAYAGGPQERSFDDPVVRLGAEGVISGCVLRGHIIIQSNGKLGISGNNTLQHVIALARSVEIGSGFKGSVQVFASDSILVGDQVCLEAGSGLWVAGTSPERLIRLGGKCEVNGYIVVNACPDKPKTHAAHYYQPSTSKVRGLVYIDGVADVHGIVNGSLYVREACYFAPEGYYAGLFYNLAVLRAPEIAYPFLMAGPYERRCVAWID